MNVKQIFLALFTIGALASCNKEEGERPNHKSESTLKFAISFDNTVTRGIEDQALNQIPNINKMVLYLKEGEKTIQTRELIEDELNTLLGKNNVTKGPITIVGVPANANKISVVANGLEHLTVNNAQTTFSTVPLKGDGDIANGANGQPKTANVNITPLYARIEIKEGITVVNKEDDKNDNGVYAVDIERIYINNIKNEKNGNPLLTPSTAFTTKYENTGEWNNLSDLIGTVVNKRLTPISDKGSFWSPEPGPKTHNLGIASGKVAAYQIFPQSITPKVADNPTKEEIAAGCPHIILKVKVYLTKEKYDAGESIPEKEYITVKSFKDTKGKLISNFEAGKIYRIDLKSLQSFFKENPLDPENPEIPVDPKPEQEKSDLTLSVTVTNWTVVDMTPEI